VTDCSLESRRNPRRNQGIRSQIKRESVPSFHVETSQVFITPEMGTDAEEDLRAD